MDTPTRLRVAAARVARLATVDAAGGPPRQVPICFALVGDTVYSAVDHKPKSTIRLARLADIAADPRAGLLIDHWDEDWSVLWWVRLGGRARIVESAAERAAALGALTAKYEQYRRQPPDGPVLALDVTAVRTWSGGGSS